MKLETKTVDGSWNSVAKRYPATIEQAEIFKLYFDQSKNPNSAKYQYILVPDATKAKLLELEKNLPVRITNEAGKQEVVSAQGWSRAIVFYKPGKSEALGGIEMDKACILMIDELMGATSVTISDPTQKLSEIKLTLKDQTWTNDQIKNEERKSVLNLTFTGSDKQGNNSRLIIKRK